MVVEPVSRDQVPSAVEVFCCPATGKNGCVSVVAQQGILAQEPPAPVFLITDGIHRERQPDKVLLQRLDVGLIGVKEVAELFVGMQGFGQNDLNEAQRKALQPAFPSLGALVHQISPAEHRRVVILQAVEEDAPRCRALILMPEDQSLPGVIHIQLGRAEEHVVVADQIPAAPEQQIRLAQRDRQPYSEPLLGCRQIGL